MASSSSGPPRSSESGVGDQLAALERLKRALAAEGLFASERKRPLPRVPRAIGLVTGADAAARGDVEAALAARFPAARLVVVEARVQGARAAGSIVAALDALVACRRVDVVIVARGGGSFEDLLPFSDERVVRAFAACPLPIVSAVGHEQDAPLCDLAADARAATPTAAVRLVVPDASELLASLGHERRRLDAALRHRVGRHRDTIVQHRQRLGLGARRAFERDRADVTRAGERLRVAPRLLLERRRAGLDTLGVALQTLSPSATLARGYAVVRHRGSAIRDASEVAIDDRVEIELAVGALDSENRAMSENVEPSFEELQRELAATVARLEQGDVPVDEAIALWRRGEELYRLCVARLEVSGAPDRGADDARPTELALTRPGREATDVSCRPRRFGARLTDMSRTAAASRWCQAHRHVPNGRVLSVPGSGTRPDRPSRASRSRFRCGDVSARAALSRALSRPVPGTGTRSDVSARAALSRALSRPVPGTTAGRVPADGSS